MSQLDYQLQDPSMLIPPQHPADSRLGLFSRPAVLVDDLLAQAHDSGHHAPDISPQVTNSGREKTLTGISEQVGFLDFSFSGVLSQ
jgi:hypothetical protein